MPVHANRPGPHDTPRGIAGNAKTYSNTRMRQWASASYSAADGRSVSSLAGEDGVGSPSTTHATGVSRQIPDAPGEHGAPSFSQRDAACTTVRTPIKNRPLG